MEDYEGYIPREDDNGDISTFVMQTWPYVHKNTRDDDDEERHDIDCAMKKRRREWKQTKSIR